MYPTEYKYSSSGKNCKEYISRDFHDSETLLKKLSIGRKHPAKVDIFLMSFIAFRL